MGVPDLWVEQLLTIAVPDFGSSDFTRPYALIRRDRLKIDLMTWPIYWSQRTQPSWVFPCRLGCIAFPAVWFKDAITLL